jgi:NTP pyrophosphatase (non-canonical NTP hydrolase)
VGELFKAIRKEKQMSIDPNSKVSHVGDELSDLLIMMCAVANRMDVNLEQAFRQKEEVNKKRNWTKQV